MCLQIEHELQAVFNLTQEAIGVIQRPVFRVGQAADLFERPHRLERVAQADVGQVAAVGELQELDGELDVADAAVPRLDLGVAFAELARFVLDLALEGLDLVDLRHAEIPAIDERLNRLDEFLAELGVARDRPHLDECLAFPGSSHGVVIGERAGERASERSAVSFGTQPQIDAVRLAAIGVRAQEPDDLGADAGEVIVVGDDGDALALSLAFLVVEEHQVDVAGIVEFLAAELAEPEDDAARRLVELGERLAEAPADVAQCGFQRDLQRRVGDARNVTRDLLQGTVADDVVGADAQHLLLPKHAEGAQDVGILVGRRDLAAKLFEHFRAARTAAQRDAQHLQKIGIGDQEIAEELAGAEQLQHRLQRAGPAFHERRHRRGPGAGEIAIQVVEGHVRVGAARQQPAQGMAQFAQTVQAKDAGNPREIAFAALDVADVPVIQELARLLKRFQTLPQFVGVHDVSFVCPSVSSGRGVQAGTKCGWKYLICQAGKWETQFFPCGPTDPTYIGRIATSITFQPM
jgi:hypothetical protein